MAAHGPGTARESKVALAPHSDPAVGPRLVCNPGDRVMAIRGYVPREVRFEGAP